MLLLPNCLCHPETAILITLCIVPIPAVSQRIYLKKDDEYLLLYASYLLLSIKFLFLLSRRTLVLLISSLPSRKVTYFSARIQEINCEDIKCCGKHFQNVTIDRRLILFVQNGKNSSRSLRYGRKKGKNCKRRTQVLAREKKPHLTPKLGHLLVKAWFSYFSRRVHAVNLHLPIVKLSCGRFVLTIVFGVW
jgi:hypothetical protein